MFRAHTIEDMNIRNIAVGLIAIGSVFVFLTQSTGAVTEITPEKIEQIKTHCTQNQASLNRLHQTDAFLRTNRGELYRTIADKLMVPLNRRLASHQLDAGQLLGITAKLNDEYRIFFNAYTQYDNAMTKLLAINCSREPVAFYTALVDAREKRAELSDSNQKIQEHVRTYGTEFGEFKKNFEANK